MYRVDLPSTYRFKNWQPLYTTDEPDPLCIGVDSYIVSISSSTYMARLKKEGVVKRYTGPKVGTRLYVAAGLPPPVVTQLYTFYWIRIVNHIGADSIQKCRIM